MQAENGMTASAALWSGGLAEFASKAEALAKDIADLALTDGPQDPAAMTTGEKLAALARDLSLIVAEYITSAHLPVGWAGQAAPTGARHVPASALEGSVADQQAIDLDPLIEDVVDTAELALQAQQLHMLAVRRAAHPPSHAEKTQR